MVYWAKNVIVDAQHWIEEAAPCILTRFNIAQECLDITKHYNSVHVEDPDHRRGSMHYKYFKFNVPYEYGKIKMDWIQSNIKKNTNTF